MKKVIAVIICFSIMLTLVACAPEKEQEVSLDCKLNFVKIVGYYTEPEFPVTKVFKTKEEFEDYYKKIYHTEIYNTEDKNDISVLYEMYKDDFYLECQKYEESFFEDNLLVFAIFNQSSGSRRYSLSRLVKNDDGQSSVNIQCDNLPGEVLNDDMVLWCAFIAIDKQQISSDSVDAVVRLDR